MNISIMKENQLSPVGKALVVICTIALAIFALINIWRGEASYPGFFIIALAGFSLFLTAKVSIIARVRRVSFGTKFMSPAMANAYRVGYWLMFVGIIGTFL